MRKAAYLAMAGALVEVPARGAAAAAKKKIAKGQNQAAINVLNDLIGQVNGFVTTGVLTAAQGQSLIVQAQIVISQL